MSVIYNIEGVLQQLVKMREQQPYHVPKDPSKKIKKYFIYNINNQLLKKYIVKVL